MFLVNLWLLSEFYFYLKPEGGRSVYKEVAPAAVSLSNIDELLGASKGTLLAV